VLLSGYNTTTFLVEQKLQFCSAVIGVTVIVATCNVTSVFDVTFLSRRALLSSSIQVNYTLTVPAPDQTSASTILANATGPLAQNAAYTDAGLNATTSAAPSSATPAVSCASSDSFLLSINGGTQSVNSATAALLSAALNSRGNSTDIVLCPNTTVDASTSTLTSAYGNMVTMSCGGTSPAQCVLDGGGASQIMTVTAGTLKLIGACWQVGGVSGAILTAPVRPPLPER